MTHKFGISQPVRRREDGRLITGTGSFTDDVNVPGQARAVFLRSSHGHGLIRSIDAGAARKAPGVLAVMTGEDLRAAGVGYIPYLPLGGFTMDPPTDTPRPALAQDRVRHGRNRLSFARAGRPIWPAIAPYPTVNRTPGRNHR